MLNSNLLRRILYIYIFSTVFWSSVEGVAHCWKRKYYVDIFGRSLNATVSCPNFYEWSVAEYCCYYDRFDSHATCCFSETYKLLIAVGLIILVLLGASISLFLCWIFNVPHYVLLFLTCGKFNLLNYMKKGIVSGPYVDPSFYAGDPFWSPGNSDIQPYPLRPMPPRIFYPTVPRNMKTRWSKNSFPNGQMPLFILASRQFTRNPYSARPHERSQAAIAAGPMSASSSFSGASGGHDQNSRRSSTTSTIVSDSHRDRSLPTLNFNTNIDEVEAAAELLEAVKSMEDKADREFIIPKLTEETQLDLDLENEKIDDFEDRRSPLGKVEDRSPTSMSGTVSRRSSTANAVMGSISFSPSHSILEEISNGNNTLLNASDRRGSHSSCGVGTSQQNANIPGFIPEEKI